MVASKTRGVRKRQEAELEAAEIKVSRFSSESGQDGSGFRTSEKQ